MHSNTIFHTDCLGLSIPDKLCHEQNMNQANINLLPLWRSLGNTGDLPVGWNGPTGKGTDTTPTPIDPVAQAKAMQQAQIEANQPAIATLQTQGKSLGDQYKTLLDTVTKQGQAAFDTATSGENAFLGARGLLSDRGLGNNELSQAQNTVNTTNKANEAAVTTEGANAQNAIAQAIAALQAGNLPQAENFALGVSGQPSQNFANYAQGSAAQIIPIPGIGVYNLSTGQIINTLGGVGGAGPSLNYTGNKISFSP